MKVSYYPGCTLKTKAKNLDQSAIASMAALGIELEEPRIKAGVKAVFLKNLDPANNKVHLIYLAP